MSKIQNLLLIEALGLPRFSTIDELSKLTGLSTRLLYCLSMKTENYYRTKFIKKRSGGERELSIPSYTLHIVQRWILVNILSKLVPTNQAMAFRRGKDFGNKQNAIRHGNTLYGLSVDLTDFFPSVTADKVYTIFSGIGYNPFAATILTNLCTLHNVLPQGSACSPAISNLVCINLDKRLAGMCEKRGIIYTRYADDMYFSCDDKALLLRCFPVFRHIIGSEGFQINEHKVHFHTPSNRKRITGITIVQQKNDETFELKAPKDIKRKIRAEIFRCIMTGDYENQDHICGEIAYVCYVEKGNSVSFLENLKSYVAKIANRIVWFPELVEAYNSHLFFKDSPQKQVEDVKINDEEDIFFYEDILAKRSEYIRKLGINDICTYDAWPAILFNS